jgi:nicotinate-nucleotide adenylyltransferase
MEHKTKIGLLGGTFNPVHRGHVELGLQIREAFQLEKILYILSAQPPHKKDQRIAPAEIRWKMLNETLKSFPQLVPCDIEMKRSTWSWTVDTVRELRKKNPGSDTEFHFISGSEGFLKIRTWKDYRQLLNTLSFIVVLRKPSHRQAIKTLLKEENVSCPVHIFSYNSDKLYISSTLIREKVKQCQPIDGLVDEEVKKIMEEYKLYES